MDSTIVDRTTINMVTSDDDGNNKQVSKLATQTTTMLDFIPGNRKNLHALTL